MHALMIEAVPTPPFGSLAKAAEVLFAVIGCDVVLTRHVEHLLGVQAFGEFSQRIELGRLG